MQVWCRVVSFLKIYLTSSNYFWMFCEGYYLHRLISCAFEAPSSLGALYAIGWGKTAVHTCNINYARDILVVSFLYDKMFQSLHRADVLKRDRRSEGKTLLHC